MNLFEDQKRWCRATIDAFERPQSNGEGPFTRVMGEAATGAGKTIMAAAIIDYVLKRWKGPRIGTTSEILGQPHQPSRVLFLADTEELVAQAQEKIFQFTGMPADREKASDRASLESRIVVGSMQTLQDPKRLQRFPAGHFAMVIVDEAHCSAADTWVRVMEYFNEGGARILGVTATPERGDERDLWKWWQHKSAEIGLFDLIALGRLAPIKVKTLPIDLDCRGVKKSKEGLDEEELAHAIEPAFEAIIEAWERHGEGRKTIWFLPGVPASRRFAEMLIERGHAARHIDGSSKDRQQILRGYAENQFLHLVNANLLIKGYDQPDIACVVNLAPGKSRVQYRQKIGRGTRIAPGKLNLLLLDFLWQFDRLGIVRPSDLVARTEKEAERIQKQLEAAARQSDRMTTEEMEEQGIVAMDLHDARDIADNQLVRALIAQLVNNTTRATKVYDAAAAAALINAPELLVYEPTAPWEKQPPTPKQLDALKLKGIKTSTIKTRGHASMLLEKLFSRQADNLCTFKQAARLTAAGVENADKLTFEQASTEMDRIIRESTNQGDPLCGSEN